MCSMEHMLLLVWVDFKMFARMTSCLKPQILTNYVPMFEAILI